MGALLRQLLAAGCDDSITYFSATAYNSIRGTEEGPQMRAPLLLQFTM